MTEDGFTRHFCGLTEAQLERIAILMEESGGIVAICGKILRHGYGSHHPDDLSWPDNLEMLEKEIGDVFHAVDMMADAGDVLRLKIEEKKREKALKIRKYLHHQEE